MISIRKSLLPIAFGIISIVVAAALVSCPATGPRADEGDVPTLSITTTDPTGAVANGTVTITSSPALTTTSTVRLNVTAVAAGTTTPPDTDGFALTATDPVTIAAAPSGATGYTHVLTWGTATTTAVFTVTGVGDTDTTNETVTVTLVDHTAYDVSSTTGANNYVITLTDVAPLPVLSITTANPADPAANGTVTITSSAALTTTSTVRLNVTAVAAGGSMVDMDGFAVTATDPVTIAAAPSGATGYTHVLTWGTATTTAMFTVTGVGDTDTANETVTVTLVEDIAYDVSSTAGANNYVITLTDVAPPPVLSITSDDPANPVASGMVTITSSAALATTSTVRLNVAAVVATTTTADTDGFTVTATSPVTIADAPDEATGYTHVLTWGTTTTTATFTITGVGDADSTNETVTVTLVEDIAYDVSSTTGADNYVITLTDVVPVLSITTDDPGSAAASGTVTITSTGTLTTTSTVRLNVAAVMATTTTPDADGFTVTATSPVEIVEMSDDAGTYTHVLTWGTTTTTAMFTITGAADDDLTNETVTVTLVDHTTYDVNTTTGANNYVITLTDVAPPVLSITDANVTTAAATTTFTITSTGALTTTSTVRLNITAVVATTTDADTDGFAVTATGPATIAAMSAGSGVTAYTHVLTWGSSSATSASLTVASAADADATNEVVTITLRDHTGYDISGTTTNTNIDIAVLDLIGLSIAASSVTLHDVPESGMGSSTITITADRAPLADSEIRLVVSYTAGSGSAPFPGSLPTMADNMAFDTGDVTLSVLGILSMASDMATHRIMLPATMTTVTFTVTSSMAESIGDGVTDPVLTFALSTLAYTTPSDFDADTYVIGTPSMATVTIDADM